MRKFETGSSSRFETILTQSIMLIFFVGLLIFTLAIFISFLRRQIDFGQFIFVFVAINLVIMRPAVVFSLGPLLVTFGQPQIAEALYSLIIRIAPRFGFAYVQRGVLRQLRKEVNEALSDYEIALNIAKDKAILSKPPLWSANYSAALIHAYKADIYLVKQDAHQAIIECSNGLGLKENNQSLTSLLHFQRAYAQLVVGNYEDALLEFNTLYFDGRLAAHESSLETELYALKALTYYNLNDFDEAKSLWQQAIRLDRNYANPVWLRDTFLWPESLLKLANQLQTA